MHRNQAVKLPTGLRQCGGSCPGPRHRATILSHPRWSPLGGRGRCTTATSSCPSPPWGTRTPILVHTTHEPSTPRLALGRGCPRPRPGGLSGAALLLRRCPYRTIWVHFSYHSADDAPPERRRDRQKSRPDLQAAPFRPTAGRGPTSGHSLLLGNIVSPPLIQSITTVFLRWLDHPLLTHQPFPVHLVSHEYPEPLPLHSDVLPRGPTLGI